MAHDRTISTECETPLPDSSDFGRSVRQRTSDDQINSIAQQLGEHVRDREIANVKKFIECGEAAAETFRERQRTSDPLPAIEQHVDANAIARRLCVDPDTIRHEMTRGNLPYVRVGRKRVVPISAVEAYVAARAVGNHPARKPTQQTVIGFPAARRRTA